MIETAKAMSVSMKKVTNVALGHFSIPFTLEHTVQLLYGASVTSIENLRSAPQCSSSYTGFRQMSALVSDSMLMFTCNDYLSSLTSLFPL